MSNYSISQKIRSRKTIFFYSVIGLLIILVATVGFLLTRNNKTARAWENTPAKLVVGENDVLYIGPGGYTSQRMWSSYGQPNIPERQISSVATAPAGNIYASTNVTGINCPTRYLDGGSFVNCNALVGDGSGMIVKYDQSIEIAGTVFITDRVVLEAPNITIIGTGKIIASGQDGSLGYGDICGYGGIGGLIGGTSSANDISFDKALWPDEAQNELLPELRGKYWAKCDEDASGNQGYQNPGLKDISSSVRPYFSIGQSDDVYGGAGGQGGQAQLGSKTSPAGVGGLLGLGGAGSSGATGTSGGDDHGSAGGGGGGFGIVFKALNSLNVSTSAIITVSGGKALNNYYDDAYPSEVSPQDTGHQNNPTGGFGGPGGGGVIIIDSGSTKFIDNAGVERAPDYSVFNIRAGTFDLLTNTTKELLYPPKTAEDGKLIILSEIGKNVSIKKSLRKISGTGSPYSVQPGDILEVTLDVSNLTPNQSVTITDEMFNDAGMSNSVFVAGSCQPVLLPCVSSGKDIKWTASPNSTFTTLKYQVEIK